MSRLQGLLHTNCKRFHPCQGCKGYSIQTVMVVIPYRRDIFLQHNGMHFFTCSPCTCSIEREMAVFGKINSEIYKLNYVTVRRPVKCCSFMDVVPLFNI